MTFDYRALLQALVTDEPLSVESPLTAPLDDLLQLAHTALITEQSYQQRKSYTNACIVRSLADLVHGHPTPDVAAEAVARLDHSIIVAGAAGRHDMVLDLIQAIQSDYLPLEPHSYALLISSQRPIPEIQSASNIIPRLTQPPSLLSFQRIGHPFILPGYAANWPALTDRPWSSLQYLESIAGRGRIVPVEVGSDYRADDWTQKLMPWDQFLQSLHSDSPPVLYLAQHSLFMQFPTLRDDIVIPDYVYTPPDHSIDYPDYQPPGNEDQIVINAWLGPKGTVSPAHTDPYHNFYAQVVGRKTVWLAPPASSMNTYPSQASHNPGANMSNTSRIDVFSPGEDFPEFWKDVVPAAMSATLEPGDLLFFPPGWWHAFRSEEISFSVSMWF